MIDPDYIGLLLQTGVRGEYVWNIEDPLNCFLGLQGPVILTFQWETISREDDKWLRPFRNKNVGHMPLGKESTASVLSEGWENK